MPCASRGLFRQRSWTRSKCVHGSAVNKRKIVRDAFGFIELELNPNVTIIAIYLQVWLLPIEPLAATQVKGMTEVITRIFEGKRQTPLVACP